MHNYDFNVLYLVFPTLTGAQSLSEDQQRLAIVRLCELLKDYANDQYFGAVIALRISELVQSLGEETPHKEMIESVLNEGDSPNAEFAHRFLKANEP